MSYISEKVAYLGGLADGLGLGDDKEDKLLRGIIDALSAIAEEMEEQSDSLDDLSECIDGIYDELDELDDDEDEGIDEDDFFEVVCPSCGETIYFDEDMLDNPEGLICPNCNEPVELHLDCDCGCDACDCEVKPDEE